MDVWVPSFFGHIRSVTHSGFGAQVTVAAITLEEWGERGGMWNGGQGRGYILGGGGGGGVEVSGLAQCKVCMPSAGTTGLLILRRVHCPCP